MITDMVDLRSDTDVRPGLNNFSSFNVTTRTKLVPRDGPTTLSLAREIFRPARQLQAVTHYLDERTASSHRIVCVFPLRTSAGIDAAATDAADADMSAVGAQMTAVLKELRNIDMVCAAQAPRH